jgi:hypothetical protein
MLKMPIFTNQNQFEQILFEEIQEALLAEGRKDDVKKKYAELDKKGYIEELSLEDPSGNNAYLAWMAKQLNNMITGPIDMPRGQQEEYIMHILNAVRAFHANKQRLKNKDLNQYKSVADLRQALDALGTTSKDKRKAEREKALSEANIVFDNADFFMVRPLTKEASCVLGKHTKWCISATKTRNYFNAYTTGEQDGAPRAFIFVRMANLDNDDDNKKMALVYNSDGELEDIFDAPDISQDVSTFEYAAQENILKGVVGDRAGAILNWFERVADISDRARPTDEELIKIAKHLNKEYEEMLVNEDLIPDDTNEEDWQDETVDAIRDNLNYISDALLYDFGSNEIVANPPRLDFSVYEKLIDSANENLRNIQIYVEDYGDYDDSMIYYGASMYLNIDELEGIDEINEENMNDVITEVVNSDSGFYIGESGVYTEVDGDTLQITIPISNEDYGSGPDGIENFIDDLMQWDDEDEKLKNAIIERFKEEGWIGGEMRVRAEDTVAYLERTLKNFREIEINDGEITAYADMEVQLPRVPKIIQAASKQMGTNAEPGPLHYLKDNITGTARSRNETLLHFMQKMVKAKVTDFQNVQKFKNAVHRVFAAAAEYADGQQKLDLKEEENPYIMADVSFNIYSSEYSYDPISGKNKTQFYIDFKANSDSTWNIKFMELADKYFKSIEDAYELSMTSALDDYFKREVIELEELLRRDKEAKTKIAANQTNEHFNNWRRFLK